MSSSSGRLVGAGRELRAGAGEFPHRHRLAEQMALYQIEPHLVRGKKIGAGLHALGDGVSAVVPRQLDDAPAYRLLQPVVGTAVDILLVDLEFGEREAPKLQQGRPFRADIVDGKRDIVQSQTLRRPPRVPDARSPRCCRFDQKPAEGGCAGMARHRSRTAAASPKNDTGRLIERSTGPWLSSR